MDKTEWQRRGQGHRQRLRDKVLQYGVESCTDIEIIEILLSFSMPRSDCKEAARAALELFKTLPAVLDATPQELQQIKGIGPKNIFALRFIQGVARRYLRQRAIGKQYVRSSLEVVDYLAHTMHGLGREVLFAVFLDASHAILDVAVVAEGTITVNTVYPRELIKTALARNAASLVFAHNHPSGALKPSAHDLELTLTLCIACSIMHIKVLDHLIIGAGQEIYSFLENGLMQRIHEKCRTIATLQP